MSSSGPLRWFESSLIPPAYHVRDASSEPTTVNALTRAVRITQLTADHSYQFPNAAAAGGAKDGASSADPELLHNRAELGSALAAVAGFSTLVPHPAPEAAMPRHSVLAYAAAHLPVTSPIDPMRLGHQLLFPAPRPSGRKQVSYLFFALQHMLKQVGKQQESAAAAASSSASSSLPAAVSVPSLLEDLPTYASWCGLAPPAAAASHGMSSVADLAIGAFTHTNAPKPPPPTYSVAITAPAAAASAGASSSTSAAAIAAAASPSSSSLPPPSTIDARFETNVEALQRFAEHDNHVPKHASAHIRLPTIMQELSVYLVGMHEIARQEYSHCQERGDLLHMLVQRCATLLQAVLPVAQREVVSTVCEFKGQIHTLLRQQEVKFDAERLEWAKINTRNSATMIQLSEEIRRLNEAVSKMEQELVRRRRECEETDRILQRSVELESQLASLREQVAAAAAWRSDQQLTLEQLHFALKQSNEARSRLEHERDAVVRSAAEAQQKSEHSLLAMQTRFLELNIPDQLDRKVKQEVQSMMAQRTKEVQQLNAADRREAGAAAEAAKFRAAASVHDAHPPTRDADPDSESSLSSDSEAEDDDAGSESSVPASVVSSRHKRPPRHSPNSMLAPPGSAHSVASASSAAQSEEAASDAESVDSDETATSVGTSSVVGSIAPSVDFSSAAAAASSASASTRRSGHARKLSTAAQLQSLSVSSAPIYAGLCKIAHLELQPSEIDAYLLTSPARFFDQFITPKQRLKFHQLQAAAAASRSDGRKVSKVHVKIGGQVGPRDWLVNFCWSVLAKRQESEAISDCYQTPRQPFPDFFYSLMLHHESVDGHKSVLSSMVLTALKSLVKYRAVVHVARVVLDLIEEKISLDGCSFLTAILTAVARTSVGIDYGPGRFGATTWVCTLRTRFVTRLLADSIGPEALKALNESVEARAECMSLAEVKQQQNRALRYGVVSEPGQEVEPMQAQQLKLLTKIDLGEFLHLASVQFSASWKTQIKNLKAHWNGAQPKAALSFAQFKAFVMQLQPNVDSRHLQQLYADCVFHSKAGRDGVRFDDFLSGGGAQLLLHDHARAVYRASDFGVVHGDKEIMAAVASNWARLKPAMTPFKQLAQTDGSALSVLLSERLTRLESDMDACLASLQHAVTSPRVRQLVGAMRDVIYEVYGFLRYREETGAQVRTHVRAHPAMAALSPASAPPLDLATAPGPTAAHLTDELHAMLFMVQREMEAFCPMQPLPAHMMIHSDER